MQVQKTQPSKVKGGCTLAMFEKVLGGGEVNMAASIAELVKTAWACGTCLLDCGNTADADTCSSSCLAHDAANELKRALKSSAAPTLPTPIPTIPPTVFWPPLQHKRPRSAVAVAEPNGINSGSTASRHRSDHEVFDAPGTSQNTRVSTCVGVIVEYCGRSRLQSR